MDFQNSNKTEKTIVSLLTIFIPTIFAISGILFFEFKISEETNNILSIINFIGLFLLLIGFIYKKKDFSYYAKIAGWYIVAFFWSTQINALYYGEEGDLINAFFCAAGVFVLIYLAYHEWLSVKSKKDLSCLNWMAGAAAIAGLIYAVLDSSFISMWLREVVAAQSTFVLNLFTGTATVNSVYITWQTTTVTIIFACTAVQSMVLFVGLILPLPKVGLKRKAIGLLITVLPVYILNLFRNALVVYLTEIYGSEFFPIAHNYIAKTLSLIALIILLYFIIKILPEVFDELSCLIDMVKRKGPIENFVRKIVRRKN
jgi:archaeosortase A